MKDITILNHSNKSIKFLLYYSETNHIPRGDSLPFTSKTDSTELFANGEFQTMSIPNNSENILLFVYIEKSYTNVIESFSTKLPNNITNKVFEFIGSEHSSNLIEINPYYLKQNNKYLYVRNLTKDWVKCDLKLSVNEQQYSFELNNIEPKKYLLFMLPVYSIDIEVTIFVVTSKLDSKKISSFLLDGYTMPKCYEVSRNIINSPPTLKEIKCKKKVID